MIKKRIVIDVETDDVQYLKATFSEGRREDLIQALMYGGIELNECAYNAILGNYLRSKNRNAFLAEFFKHASQADERMINEIEKSQIKTKS